MNHENNTQSQVMLSAEEFRQIMEKLEKSNAGQEKYAKKQYRMSQITALASILVLCTVLYTSSSLIPKVNQLLDDIQVSVTNIQDISQDLADADLPKMIQDVDNLVSTSESSIQTAVDKLNSIDFDALNSAITDLSNIVRPLGRLFGN
ncbi:MAG: hypothetical protein Q4E86_14750 [Lachnospiraceae bacterium]|nr:hypothetical protein [Lachnospiraceae bacterium]